MARTRNVVVGIVIASIFALFIVMVVLSFWSLTRKEGMSIVPGVNRVAIIEIIGTIENSDNIVRQLKKYGDDGSVPAIVLRIDSPGGAVAPSQEIYAQILKLRESGKVVIASFGSLAASGGYYIACACDSIVANPGSVTGSIGVVMSFLTFEGLMDKVGVELEVVKSGELKDVGNFSRELTLKEREMLQAAINDVYNQFVMAVSVGRNMDIVQVEELADGSIYTGNQALELGLVDELGTYDDAIALAGEMTGLGREPRTVKELPRPKRLLDFFVEKIATALDLRAPSQVWPKLEYIYR